MDVHPAPMQAERGARQLGALTLEQKRTIERLAGRDALDRVLTRLPREQREEFEALSLFSWCRCSTLNVVLAGLASELGRNEDEFVREVVRESFGTVLRTMWRLLARFSSDTSIVERASSLYGRALDRGKARAFVQGPSHLVMEISERPDLSHIDIVSIGAAVEAAMELAGRRVRITHRRVHHGVRYDVYVRATLPPTGG